MSTSDMRTSDLVHLRGRAVASSKDRPAWLEARRKGVTATEVAKLAEGSAAYWRDLLAEKRTGVAPDLSRNRYVQRGKEREPVIAAWVQETWPHLMPNDTLFHALHNKRHLATPDGVGEDWGDLELLEIKTSKHDLSPQGEAFDESTYWDQMQWQMYVTGSEQCLFVWEQHDDDWVNGPTPVHEEPQFHRFKRDNSRIDELREVVDRFLVDLDSGAVDTSGLDAMVVRRFELEDQLAAVKDAMEEWLINNDQQAAKGPWGSLTYQVPKARRALDQGALKADHPDLVASYTKESEPGRPVLRVVRSKR